MPILLPNCFTTPNTKDGAYFVPASFAHAGTRAILGNFFDYGKNRVPRAVCLQLAHYE